MSIEDNARPAYSQYLCAEYKNHGAMKHYLAKLEETVRSRWTQKALCDYKGDDYTYADVARNIEEFRLFLAAAGIESGAKVALCGRNSARWAMTFWGVNVGGCVAVPLLADFHPDSIAALVTHSDSILLFTDKDIWERLSPDDMPKLRAAVNIRDGELLWYRDEDLAEAWEARTEAFRLRFPEGLAPSQVSYHTYDGGELAIINYTSGTTGNPKGVMLTYGALSDTDDFSNSHFPNHPGETIVSMLPLAHMYGLAIEFIHPNIDGVTVYFLGKTPSPTTRKQVCGAFGGRVRCFIMGGAALRPEVERCFRKMRLPYMVGYGMTEACPLLGWEWWTDFVPGSCGKPVHEIRIDSDDPAHIAGEIQARGANMTIGYYKNPEADAAAFTEDGWFRTGDLGLMDEDGNIFIRGRLKSMILNSSGQNIYPEELEAVLAGCPYVAESLVLDRGGKIVALVYPELPDGTDREAEYDIPERIRSQANRSLPSYSQIAKVELVDRPFEKTPKMSIKRYLYK